VGHNRLSIGTAWLVSWLMLAGATDAIAMPSQLEAGSQPDLTEAISNPAKLAQAQPAPAPAASPSPAPESAEPIGNVATLTGHATVTRNNASTPLNLQDDIFENDVLQTAANSTLGVTFNDATTFSLTASAQITVDFYVYEDGGQKNGALFDIAKGTVAFVAAAVAKTGDMRISTPTATLGIRGTTGLIEVPEGASATGANNVAIKLYPDADGRVGQIEVNGRDGTRLGSLTQGASGFSIRPGAGGRLTAQPLVISPQQALRDQGIVRQVHAAQNVGRQIVTQRRIQRQQNPGNNPARNYPTRQPGPQRLNGLPQRPGAPTRPAQPNPPTLRQPGPQKQDGLPQRSEPAQPNRAVQQGGARPAPGLQRPPNAPGVRQGELQRKPAPPKPRPAAPAPKKKPEREPR
jgi:hypothetical protein